MPTPLIDASTPAMVNNNVSGTTALVTASFTPPAGSIVVAKVTTGGADQTSTTPTGLTFTPQVNAGTGSSDAWAAISTAVGGGSSVAVTVGFTGAAHKRMLIVEVWTGGLLGGTPAAHGLDNSFGAPSDSLTTATDNGIVSWICADFNGVDGASRAYLTTSGTPVETGYATTAGSLTSYSAWQAAPLSDPQTYGLSAPTGQNGALASFEIQDGSDFPYELNTNTPRYYYTG